MLVTDTQYEHDTPTPHLPGKLWLLVRDKASADELMDLPSGKTMVGSSPRCNVRIQRAGVQPLHCLIVHEAEGLTIRRWAADTLLNGAPFDDAPLAAGDRLSLGPVDVEIVGETTDGEVEVHGDDDRVTDEGCVDCVDSCIDELVSCIEAEDACVDEELLVHEKTCVEGVVEIDNARDVVPGLTKYLIESTEEFGAETPATVAWPTWDDTTVHHTTVWLDDEPVATDGVPPSAEVAESSTVEVEEPVSEPVVELVSAVGAREVFNQLQAANSLSRVRSRKLLAALRHNRDAYRQLTQRVDELELQMQEAFDERENRPAEIVAFEQPSESADWQTAEIDRLTTQMQTLTEQIEELDEAKAQLADENAALALELPMLRQQLATAHERYAEWDHQSTEWERQRVEWEMERGEWERRRSEWQHQMGDWESRIEDHVRRIEELERQLAEAHASGDRGVSPVCDAGDDAKPSFAPAVEERGTSVWESREDTERRSQPAVDERGEPCAVETPSNDAPVWATATPTAAAAKRDTDTDFEQFSEFSIWKQRAGEHESAAVSGAPSWEEENPAKPRAAWEEEASALAEPAQVEANSVEVTPPVVPTVDTWRASPESAGQEPVAQGEEEHEAPVVEKVEPHSYIERYKHLFAEEDGEGNTPPATPARHEAEPEVGKLQNVRVARDGGAAAAALASADEESVEDYMKKLMQRVRGEKPGPPASQAPAPETESAKVNAASAAGKPSESVSSGDGRNQEPMQDLSELAEFVRKTSTPSRPTNLAALRALANESARHAIGVHATKKHRRDATTKFIVATLAGFTSLWLMLEAPDWRDLQFIAACGSLMIAAYWAGQTYFKLVEMSQAGDFDTPQHDGEFDELNPTHPIEV